MKTRIQNPVSEQGSILLTTLIISGIIGVTLASYMIMMQAQNASVSRSQTWNSAIVTSEGGVEDALALLNNYGGSFEKLTNWSSSASIAQDNWSAIGGNTYFVKRYVGNSYYNVYITNVNNAPVIRSEASVPWYYTYNSAPQSILATAGIDELYTPKRLKRSVEVKTRIDALFNVAMAAILEIDFNGRNVQTDSFDSANPAYSDNGLYPFAYPDRQKANGDVVTDYTINNALNAGNAKIKGQAKTGPKGTLKIGPGGSVGDKAWVESGNTGVQPGHYADDMNVLFPPVVLPITTWSPPQYQNVTITYYGYVTNKAYQYAISSSGDYTIPDVSGSIFIWPGISVRLKITGTVNITGEKDEIRIGGSDSGASKLKIYMDSGTFRLAGNGIVNPSGNAANFYLFGTQNNTRIEYAGNGTFTGAVYAPGAEFRLGGGGYDVFDFIGASVSKTVQMNGHYNFHYDENLAKNGMGRGYVPTNWKEN